MALSYPMKASLINVEGGRTSTANAPLAGAGATSVAQAGSLIKLFVGSGVDQNASYAYSDFLNKSYLYQQIYGSVGGQQFNVCGLAYTPYYFGQTGTETSPAIGTRCFSNISGTVLTQNWHRRDQTSRMNIDSNGDVNAIVNTACTP